jgi:hypothetical protein
LQHHRLKSDKDFGTVTIKLRKHRIYSLQMQNTKKKKKKKKKIERHILSTEKLWSAVIGRKLTRAFRVLSFAENSSRILLHR